MLSCKSLGLAVTLILVSLPATSHARYTFGRLKSEVVGPGTWSRAAKLQPECTAFVPEYLKEVSGSYGGPEYTEWGSTARDNLIQWGLPVEIDDDGFDCSTYSGNVYLHFRSCGEDFWVTAYNGNFHNQFFVYDSRIGNWGCNNNLLTIYASGVTIWKQLGCPGHNEWHASAGTGGPGWSFIVNATYFKSG
jgi:hypothetical protein